MINNNKTQLYSINIEMALPEIIITGLNNEQNYNIDVFSLSSNGLSDRSSNYIQVTPTSSGTSSHRTIAYSSSSPSVPSNMSSTSSNNSGSISWQSSGESIIGYIVWYYDTTYHLFTVLNNDITKLNINSLSNGTIYKFTVSSYNLHGISQMSQQVSIAPKSDNVPCLVIGTQVLTTNGYKSVELLDRNEDIIVTSDGRHVPFYLLKYIIEETTAKNAPYCIKAGAFGRNFPTEDIHLSPLHAFRISNKLGLWQIPLFAAKHNTAVIQEELGKKCEYYHVMLPNYFTDNLVIQGGNVVESFCGKRENYNLNNIYKFNRNLGGFTRKNPKNTDIHKKIV